LQLANGMGHLTYSTLVHAGDTWDDIWASVRKFVPQVKENVCPSGKCGFSLRMSLATAETLTNAPGSCAGSSKTATRISIPSTRFRTDRRLDIALRFLQ